MKVLVLNSGSSSQKACLYEIGETLPTHPPPCLWEGRIEWGSEAATISVKNSQGGAQQEQMQVSPREEFVRHLLGTLDTGPARALGSVSEIDVVEHRVVHGGPHFENPVFVAPEARAAIEGASKLAPLHIRAELQGMDYCREPSRPGPTDRRLGHRLPSSDAAFFTNVSRPIRLVREWNSPLWIPRYQLRVPRRTRCSVAGKRVAVNQSRELPPWATNARSQRFRKAAALIPPWGSPRWTA